MRNLLRFWFTFDQPVSRRAYFAHGFGLALLKYAFDAALIWTFLGVPWTPIDYLAAGVSLGWSKLGVAPASLATLLAVWTAPFFWIGLTMSARRARDAGVTPWLSQMFFVPLLNYLFIAAMCVAPSAASASDVATPESLTSRGSRTRTALTAIGFGAAAGWLLVFLAVRLLRTYGASLFFGTPLIIGAVTAYVFNRSYAASRSETTRVVLLSLVVTGLAMIMFAAEGLLCLLMAFPLAAVIALLGSAVGRWIAVNETGSPHGVLLAILLVPATAPLVDARRIPVLHEVRSAIEIDAPASTVWRNVIAFPPLDEPTEFVFRSGIAFPVAAHIDGEGVGAVRYCEFSTGPFVEPITRWEPNSRLSFDVTRQPAPMRELSPYRIAPPHLDGYFDARRGEFRLVALPGGRTRLEGSTWYELRIDPQVYWTPMADALVSRIHQRVLRHIKAISER